MFRRAIQELRTKVFSKFFILLETNAIVTEDCAWF